MVMLGVMPSMRTIVDTVRERLSAK